MIEKLQQAMIQAMKDKNTEQRDTFRSAIAAIRKTAIDRQCEITDELTNEVLLKEAKTIQEQIDTCPEDRVILQSQYKARLMYLDPYLPKLETDPEVIKEIIEKELAAAGIEPVKASKGAAMKLLMPQFKGKADMKIVNQVITEVLQ
jgi:uncharacterized protein YqeY